jgi:hypothetical protein
VVALRARLVGPQGVVLERTYRGVATRVNWASAGAELDALLNEALTAAVGGRGPLTTTRSTGSRGRDACRGTGHPGPSLPAAVSPFDGWARS